MRETRTCLRRLASGALAALMLTGAMTLASCMMEAPQSNERVHEPASQPLMASDPTMETAVEMVYAGKYDQASKLLEQLVGGYEAGNLPHRASEAIFWLGYCREKSGNFAEAARQYRRVMEKYAMTEAARKSSDRLDGLGAQTAPATTGPAVPLR